MHIGVIGVGSIGSVLAEGFDALGHEVLIHDQDDDREAALPYRAPDLDDLAQQSDLCVLAIPTPTTDDGGDASAVVDVCERIDQGVGARETTVCIRSTMPPGSTAAVDAMVEGPVVYSPEFLRDRSDVADFFNPDRVVLAGPAKARDRLRNALDRPGFSADQWFTTDDYLTAELGKYAHNALFATKVSFANQMRAIAEAGGADAEIVMDIVTADSRNTASHLDPMLGPYGGKCLPKDLAALRHYAAESEGVPTPLLDGTHEMNQIARDEFDNLDIAGSWPDVTVQGD